MKAKKTLLLTVSAFALGAFSAPAAPLLLQEGTYNQTFNTFTQGVNPFPSWNGYQSATATSLGTVINPIGGSPAAWSDTGGSLKNVSSANIPFTSTTAEQAANPDRAFAIRQVNLFGDPGASISFNFSSASMFVQEIKLDVLLLNIAANRSTTFSIQYGLGTAPSSFTDLGTYSDTGVLGSTNYTFDREDFGSALDGQSSVWFRFAALTPSAGSGGTRDLVAIDNFSITSTSTVPEPSTCALIGLGALGAVLASRRRSLKAWPAFACHLFH